MSGNIILEESGAASAGSILDRLSNARDKIGQQSNRFGLVGLVFFGFLVLRLIGLRVDLVFFGQKIFELPYGIFVFCVSGQICVSISILRWLDARVIDRFMLGVCEQAWPRSSQSIYESYPDVQAWLSSLEDISKALKEWSWHKALHSLAYFFVGTLLLLVFAAPVAAGVWVLSRRNELIVGGDVDAQFCILLGSTVLTALVLINALSVLFADDDD